MPRLVIDDLAIEVPAGTRVITAAERLGIMVPRFCYHPALGSVGACRMCAVKFLEGPVKGLQMSCMVEAQDGMKVSTTDPEAMEFRKYIIELLMLHHPHDCPVCDEGGQCLLQDETVSGGHGRRRYEGRKRTYRDQDLGPLIAHEMNRCIHCYRCVRFYQNVAGCRDLGALQIANKVSFGRFRDGPLESPFAGNLVDLCPTGVFTDKPARYKGRRWDFERGPSICIHCSLGCNTIANVRYRSVVRVEARLNEAVNGYFICDRGRFGFGYANHPERPRQARVDGVPVSLDDALRTAAGRLSEVLRTNGPKAVAWVGSTRSSLETQTALAELAEALGSEGPAFCLGSEALRKAVNAVRSLDESLAVSLGDLGSADFVLVLGADPINEAPMLALALRQAFRGGASVAVLDPRPVELPMPFDHLPLPTRDLEGCFLEIVDSALGNPGREVDPILSRIVRSLRSSRYPVVVCGTDIVRPYTPIAVARGARRLLDAKGSAGLFFLLPGPNAFGAVLVSTNGGAGLESVLEAIEGGMVQGVVFVECDPLGTCPDRERLRRALDRVPLLVALDYLPSETVQCAHIALPTATLFETGSTFVNHEGRIQWASPVFRGGLPVSQASGGGHPPRVYGGGIPGGEPQAAWRLLNRIGRSILRGDPIGDETDPLGWFMRRHPAFEKAAGLDYPHDGVRCLFPGGVDWIWNPGTGSKAVSSVPLEMEILLAESLHGTEELSRYAEITKELEKPPHVLLHPADAEKLGVVDDRMALAGREAHPVEVSVKLCERMAPGAVIIPRHRRLAWQKIAGVGS